MRLPPWLNILCKKEIFIASHLSSISQGKRQSLARRTTRNDILSIERSSAPLGKGRRPALAGLKGFIEISNHKYKTSNYSEEKNFLKRRIQNIGANK